MACLSENELVQIAGAPTIADAAFTASLQEMGTGPPMMSCCPAAAGLPAVSPEQSFAGADGNGAVGCRDEFISQPEKFFDPETTLNAPPSSIVQVAAH